MRFSLIAAAAVACMLSMPSAHAQSVSAVPGAPAGLSEVLESYSTDPADVQRVIITVEPAANDISALGIYNATEQARKALIALAQKEGALNVQALGSTDYIVAETTRQQIADIAAYPAVRAVFIDEAYRPVLDVALQVINGQAAHAQGANGNGQVVVVLDTGVDVQHDFFSGRISGEACFSSTTTRSQTLCPNGANTQIGQDAATPCVADCAHGTHVAGIAAGANNQLVGAGPEARIYAIQVFSRFGAGDLRSFTSDLIRALDHVFSNVSHTQRVASANLSLGGPGDQVTCPNHPLAGLIGKLRAIGIATVIASGNDSSAGFVSAPGCVPSAVTVGATNNQSVVATFSNSGAAVDMVAPGVSIRSSLPGGTHDNYGRMSGTSMATPMVAGAFAALQSFRLTTVDLIENSLKSTGAMVPLLDPMRFRPRIDLLAATNQLASSVPNGAFMWMRDTWSDTGAEPDPATAGQVMSNSPALWVRRNNDCNADNRDHENPEHGQANYICVEVQNGGKAPGNGKLQVYITRANIDSAAGWDLISTYPMTVPAKQRAIVALPWGNVPAPGHYCLLAFWVDEDQPDQLQLPGGIVAAVRNSNNLIWHNLNIVDLNTNSSSQLRFEPRSGGKITIAVEVRATDPSVRGSMGTIIIRVPGSPPNVSAEPTSRMYRSDSNTILIPLEPGIYYIPDIERPSDGGVVDVQFRPETVDDQNRGQLMNVAFRIVTDLAADKAGHSEDSPAVTYLLKR